MTLASIELCNTSTLKVKGWLHKSVSRAESLFSGATVGCGCEYDVGVLGSAASESLNTVYRESRAQNKCQYNVYCHIHSLPETTKKRKTKTFKSLYRRWKFKQVVGRFLNKGLFLCSLIFCNSVLALNDLFFRLYNNNIAEKIIYQQRTNIIRHRDG